MTKAELQVQIDNIDTGGVNSALEVRNTLEAIRDNVYPDEMVDSDVTQTYITPQTGVTFNVTIVKIGRTVTLSGKFRAVTNNVLLTLGTITDNELQVADGKRYISTAILNPGTNPMMVAVGRSFFGSAPDTYIVMYGSLLIGEEINFSITYNVEN